MPRYLVERSFSDGFKFPGNEEEATVYRTAIKNNAEDFVTWVHSYVSADKAKSYCIIDGPNPEAIRRVAERNKLPVDRITEVSVLDPYYYK